jgi:hypothetical protein
MHLAQQNVGHIGINYHGEGWVGVDAGLEAFMSIFHAEHT